MAWCVVKFEWSESRITTLISILVEEPLEKLDRDGDGILILRGIRDSVTSRVETRAVAFVMHCWRIVTAVGCVAHRHRNEIPGAVGKAPILNYMI